MWLHALQTCYQTRVGLNILSLCAPDGWHTRYIKLDPVHLRGFTHPTTCLWLSHSRQQAAASSGLSGHESGCQLSLCASLKLPVPVRAGDSGQPAISEAQMHFRSLMCWWMTAKHLSSGCNSGSHISRSYFTTQAC